MFKDTMEEIGQPCIPSKVVETLEDAVDFAEEIGLPVIVRPAFTMGGTGGGIANTMEELHEIAENGLRLSPITQILVEKCISGWKEIEFEVIRDSEGNAITVCSHGKPRPGGRPHRRLHRSRPRRHPFRPRSISMLRAAAIDIVNALGVEGGCNCQFALQPAAPRTMPLSRSTPVYPVRRHWLPRPPATPSPRLPPRSPSATRLDEIRNAVTGTTYACYEPAVDYIVGQVPQVAL